MIDGAPYGIVNIVLLFVLQIEESIT